MNLVELKELKPPDLAVCAKGLDVLGPLVEVGAITREDAADFRSLDCG